MQIIMKKYIFLLLTICSMYYVSAQYPNPNTTIAYGPGLVNGTAGEFGRFIIEARDQNNQPCCFDGGANFLVTFWEKDRNATITDRKNGTYDVIYNLTERGNTKIEVFLRNTNNNNNTLLDLTGILSNTNWPINGSPWFFWMNEGPVSPQHCLMFTNLQRNGTMTEGDTTTIRIYLRDRFLNGLSTTDNVKGNITIIHINSQKILDVIMTAEEGIFKGQFNASILGTIMITLMVNYVPIPGSPLFVTIIPKTYPPKQPDPNLFLICMIIACSLLLVCLSIKNIYKSSTSERNKNDVRQQLVSESQLTLDQSRNSLSQSQITPLSQSQITSLDQ
jgi:hypothetical protein